MTIKHPLCICMVAHFQKITITTGRVETQILYFTVPIYQRKCMVPNILLEKFAYLNYRMFFELGQISQEWVPKGVKFESQVKFEHLYTWVDYNHAKFELVTTIQWVCRAGSLDHLYRENDQLWRSAIPWGTCSGQTRPFRNQLQNLVDDNVYNDIWKASWIWIWGEIPFRPV